MKHSLKQGGGYLEIDHRDSPGLTPEDVAHVPGAVPIAGGQLFETDAYHCTHCQRGVVRFNASGKKVDPPVCLKCNHYICKGCYNMYQVTGQCVPFEAVIDRAAELAVKFAGQPDHPDATKEIEQLSMPGPPRIVLTDL